MSAADKPLKKTSTAIDRDRFPIDPWALVETAPGHDAGLMGTLFAVGNGYLGMRADHAPDPQSAGTYINGLHETFDIHHAENSYGLARVGQSVLEAPDTKSIELTIDGEALRLDPYGADPTRVDGYQRRLDFRAGVLRTSLRWTTASGVAADVTFERVVSLTRRHLAGQRLTVTVDVAAHVGVRSQLVNRQEVAAQRSGPMLNDPRRGRSFDRRVFEPVAHLVHDADSIDAMATLAYRAKRSEMLVAAAQRHVATGATPIEAVTTASGDRAETAANWQVPPGESLTLVKFAAYHTSDQIPGGAEPPLEDFLDACGATLDEAIASGWDTLLAEQRAWLDDFWSRTDIEIDGDPAAQQAVRWNLFHLAQAAAQVGVRGIAAKAVTAPGYDGHYFWDTEVYVAPLLASTNPALARPLLEFRHRLLPAARRRAIDLSQVGALYPWRTIMGEEASGYYPAGTAQYHIDAAVAYAIERYVTASGDQQFVAQHGAEMLVELARLYADLGFYGTEQPPVFHIHGVTGPDEYTAVVDDNLYTNVMARFTLRYAAATAQALESSDPTAYRALVSATGVTSDEVADWLAAAEAMCVPFDDELRINPQDDAFLRHEAWDWDGTPPEKYPLLLNFHSLVIYRHQVLKQADVVLAMFIRGDDFDRDLQRRNFDYYDPITTGDSSLSACVQSIVASQVGHPDLAWHYFDQSLYLDIADTHGNTEDGAHIANVGGVWAALVHGFGGVRDNGVAVQIAPRLPVAWTALRFRLQRRGSQILFELDAGGATVTVESGDPVPVVIDDSTQLVEVGGSVRVAPDRYVVGP